MESGAYSSSYSAQQTLYSKFWSITHGFQNKASTTDIFILLDLPGQCEDDFIVLQWISIFVVKYPLLF